MDKTFVRNGEMFVIVGVRFTEDLSCMGGGVFTAFLYSGIPLDSLIALVTAVGSLIAFVTAGVRYNQS